MLDMLRNNPALKWAAALVAVFAALAVIRSFFVETAPWLADLAGGWGALVLAFAAVCLAAYFGYQYDRYRRATRKLMWRYIIDVQDARVKQPHAASLGLGAGQSEEVKRGEASADPAWGDHMYRELLHLPPEKEYR